MSATVRVDTEACFLLHTRAYRETSQILDVLSQRHGRVSLVARGARTPDSKLRGLLQPFRPLHLSWAGRGSLFSLRSAEVAANGTRLTGERLMSGFYLNELLLVFLHPSDPHPDLFAHYAAAVAALGEGYSPEPVLRRFEIELLAEVGYGMEFGCDATTGEPVDAAQHYEYVVDRGPVPVPVADGRRGPLVFTGAELLALGAGELQGEGVLDCAKRLLRAVINHHLDGRQLKTRRVFVSMRV